MAGFSSPEEGVERSVLLAVGSDRRVFPLCCSGHWHNADERVISDVLMSEGATSLAGADDRAVSSRDPGGTAAVCHCESTIPCALRDRLAWRQMRVQRTQMPA